MDKNKKQEDHPGLAISAYFLKKYPKRCKRVHLGPMNSDDDDLWKFLKEVDARVERARHVNLTLD